MCVWYKEDLVFKDRLARPFQFLAQIVFLSSCLAYHFLLGSVDPCVSNLVGGMDFVSESICILIDAGQCVRNVISLM